MQYLLIARDKSLADAWKAFFHDQENVDVVQGDLCAQACDAVVSPANSFGFMDGGVDYALSMRLGWHVQERLQRMIQELPEGELLVT